MEQRTESGNVTTSGVWWIDESPVEHLLILQRCSIPREVLRHTPFHDTVPLRLMVSVSANRVPHSLMNNTICQNFLKVLSRISAKLVPVDQGQQQFSKTSKTGHIWAIYLGYIDLRNRYCPLHSFVSSHGFVRYSARVPYKDTVTFFLYL